MSKILATIISNSGVISLVTQGKTHTVGTNHMRYADIIKAIKSGDTDNIIDMIDVTSGLKKAIKKTFNKEVELKNGVVTYLGEALHNSCTKRIVELWKGDLPFLPMIKFLEKLLKNPDERAINELYTFLDCNNLPITEDGCFLAYKRIDNDWKDMHTHTIDNSIGKIVTMPRNKVDNDKNRTCSTGLHFCSRGYLGDFGVGTGHIVAVKINPADVVSIPTDYNNTKGRCCKYEVLMEVENDVVVPDEGGNKTTTKDVPEAFDKPLYTKKGEKFVKKAKTVVKPVAKRTVEITNLHNVRGADGRFVKAKDSLYGVKPDGSKFHNVRGKGGRFIAKRK
jgi:hypothetical protein